jgi:phenylacetate-CoA ligase
MMSTSTPELIRSGETYDEIETFSPSQLADWQLGRVREVVADAAAGNAFYADRWQEAGIDGAALAGWDDFRRLPIIAKPDLVAAGENWSTRRGPVAFSTRGTSGEPLVVWLDTSEAETFLPPTMRGYWWAGFRPGETALMQSPAWHRLAAMEGRSVVAFGGRVAYFWGSGGPQYANHFVDALERVRPEYVTTTAPFVISLVRRLDDEEIDPQELFASVRSLTVVGLPLTPQLRQHLSDRLGAELFERSGTQEGAAADECSHHTAPHVHADVCHLEVLDEDGAPVAEGSRGRLVVTKLHAEGDPVVRYDTGDIAELFNEPCSCGRELPRIKIYGRPESSVDVAGRTVTAYDVRSCVDADPDLVGRLVLLVRDQAGEADVLSVAIEGDPHNVDGVEKRLSEHLGIEKVDFSWLGNARMAWGFRQVIDKSEVQQR